MMFKRILIANRGEIAVRIIRACRELAISPVAVYSQADAGALHVRLADAAAPVGPPAAAESYLRSERIIAAALALGADAIHPGYGFLSENADFARACAAAGLTFIGPPPAAIDAMGGKIGARALAQAAEVPVVPGYDGADQSLERLLHEADRIGYPLLIKASAGGGGKGMRIVQHAAEFADALAGAQREAQAAFGDATVFLERLILRPRHVEIQIFADNHGNVIHLGERECSIQRRHQKILEESPSPKLTPALRAAMGDAAVRVARAAGYVNAGTVEFVLDEQGAFYFLEMNTRLQVEHPVTEFVTGIDLVHLQIAVAAGQPLPLSQAQVQQRGHAIEVRLYAEDPQTFLPAIGRLLLFDPPAGPAIRVDAGLVSGDEVTVHYDPMLAKLIVYGSDRAAAIARLRYALSDLAVLGLTTNLPLLHAIAAHPAFAAGDTHTGFLQEHPLDTHQPAVPAPLVFAAAAIHRLRRTPASTADPFATLWRASSGPLPLRFQIGDETYLVAAADHGDHWQVRIGPDMLQVVVVAHSADAITLRIDDQQVRLRMAYADDSALLLAWAGHSYRLALPAPLSADSVSRAAAGHAAAGLTAPMPGTLIRVLVAEGQSVQEGQALLVLEAMKMEHTVIAPYSGVVRHLPFQQGAGVAAGAALIDLTPSETA